MAGSRIGKQVRTKQNSKPNPNNKPLVESKSKPELGGTRSKDCPMVSDTHSEMECWNSHSEEALEELLFKKLEIIYSEAFSRLLGYGHSGDVAQKAILMNGHVCGNTDMLKNIVHNCLDYIKHGSVIPITGHKDGPRAFEDLSQLLSYSIKAMVHLARLARPSLTKVDAMLCLLMNNFDLGQVANVNSVHVSCVEHELRENDNITKDLNAFIKGDISLKKCNMTRDMASTLKMNVSIFSSGFRAKLEASLPSLASLSIPVPSNDLTTKKCIEDSDLVASVLGDLDKLSLDEKENGSMDPRNEIIMSLVSQIRELETQVNEQKQWAQKKVIQAAKKLSHDLSDLKVLRIEKLEKQTEEKNVDEGVAMEASKKKLTEMEDRMRESSCRVDKITAAMRQLEIQNSEIKAEKEAFHISASESDMKLMETEKREKKCIKRVLALEKQNNKLEEDIEGEKQKYIQFRHQLLQLGKAKRETEVKWRQEVETKKQAASQVEEELRLKKEAELGFKKRQETLRRQLEIDSLRFDDDLKRLEHEVSRLQMTPGLTVAATQANESCSVVEEFRDWGCLICKQNPVTVVFLPCAHQVLCASCSEGYDGNFKSWCLVCQVHIERVVRVYGPSA